MRSASRILRSEFLVLVLCGVYAAAVAPFTPGFATWGNLLNILVAMLPLLVVASGQTIVLISAGIDLSVTSVIALASVLGSLLVYGGSPGAGAAGPLAGSALAVPAAVAVMLGTGAAVGLVNGLCVARLRMPPFIVTLTTMMCFSGLAVWVAGSKSIGPLPEGLVAIGKNPWAATAVTAAVCVAAQLALSRTLAGRWLYATGQNPAAAHVSGVPTARVLAGAYVVCGLCAGAGAVLITGLMESGSPVHWRDVKLLDIIGAAVIGGTSLFGGSGKIYWTFFGVLFLTLVDNSLNLLNLSYFTIMIAKGVVILAAALLDAARHRMRAGAGAG